MDTFTLERLRLVACLKRLQSAATPVVIADPEFRQFSTIRNRFNDYQVTRLIEEPPYSISAPKYRDGLGRIWKEEVFGIVYHIPPGIGSKAANLTAFGEAKKKRYSRKFLLEADLPGYTGATFEMIVTPYGRRITSGELMETFNFGPSTARQSMSGEYFGKQIYEAGLHYKFDIAPHKEYGPMHYKSYEANHRVRIIDFSDLYEQGAVGLSDISI